MYSQYIIDMTGCICVSLKQHITCKPYCEGNDKTERTEKERERQGGEREEGKPAALPLQGWGNPAAAATLCCKTEEKVCLTHMTAVRNAQVFAALHVETVTNASNTECFCGKDVLQKNQITKTSSICVISTFFLSFEHTCIQTRHK